MASLRNWPHWRYSALLMSGGMSAYLYSGLFILGISSAFAVQNGELAEFLLLATPIVTPFLLAPTLFALHAIYRSQMPQTSRWMLITGCIGLSAFVLLPLFYFFTEVGQAPAADVMPWLLGWNVLLLMNGVWMLLAGYLGLRTQLLPSVALGILGIVTGVVWLLVIAMVLLMTWEVITLSGVFSTIFLGGLVTLIAAQSIWAIGIGTWLCKRPNLAN